MKKILMIAALAAAPAAFAETSYSYLDVNYQFGGEIDFGGGATIDDAGFGFELSYALNDAMFVAFEYTDLSTDPSAVDTTDYSLAIGWHGELAYAKLGYESAEISVCAVLAPPCAFDDSGFMVDFGLRGNPSDEMELNAHVGYSDLGDLDTFTNFGFGAVYMFSESAGVSFNYDLRSGDGIDYTSYGLGIRVTFD